MNSPSIKNIIFDIGNVLVRWSPIEIIRLTFGEIDNDKDLAKALFQSDLWLAYNRGEFSESEAKRQFQTQFRLSEDIVEVLFYYIKQTQIPIYGMHDLVKRVKLAGYNTYALTDNVLEIVDHLKTRYDFWDLFLGAIVSAEVKCLKPSAQIFNCLLDTYHLKADKCVFIDDVLANVEGAKTLGFNTILFKNAAQCERELHLLGITTTV